MSQAATEVSPARAARLGELAARAQAGAALSAAELAEVAAIAGPGGNADLLDWAGRLRQGSHGNGVRLCAIAATKVGGCSEDCPWCAQATGTGLGSKAPVRMSTDEAVDAAKRAAQLGVGCFSFVNSGRRPSQRDLDEICRMADAVASQPGRPANLAASLGAINEPDARRLASAGITRYHHNLETSRRMFARLVRTHTYDERLATLAAARSAGLSICSGGLFGLGEDHADRIELALTLREHVRPDNVPLNFLTAIPGTPLAAQPAMTPAEILTTIALFRLAMPAGRITIAGGRGANLRDMQSLIFQAGADGVMIGNYLVTPGRVVADDLKMLTDLGLEPVPD